MLESMRGCGRQCIMGHQNIRNAKTTNNDILHEFIFLLLCFIIFKKYGVNCYYCLSLCILTAVSDIHRQPCSNTVFSSFDYNTVSMFFCYKFCNHIGKFPDRFFLLKFLLCLFKRNNINCSFKRSTRFSHPIFFQQLSFLMFHFFPLEVIRLNNRN